MKNNGFDQFYTKDYVAKYCYNLIKTKIKNFNLFDLELEPSAGTGAFYNLMTPSKRYGIDIEPKCVGVIKQNFFNYHAPKFKNIITIGNPPFGKNASLAIKFFNHAANFSNVIAFIVPKSFKKVSIQNKLNYNFWLLYEQDCFNKSFIVGGMEYDVPCVFQIWTKKKVKRNKKVMNLNNDIFDFVNKNNADLAIRRVGGTTGRCKEVQDSKETTHYFIKIKQKNLSKHSLMRYINSLNFDSVRNSTAGARSLSKYELIEIFLNNIGELK